MIYGINLPVGDEHFVHFELGRYQRDTWACALEYCDERRTFIDVGAHIGHFTQNALNAGFKHVWAFEPIAGNMKCLTLNVKVPDGAEFHPVKVAVGDRNIPAWNGDLKQRERLVAIDPSDGRNSGAWEISFTHEIATVPKRAITGFGMISLDSRLADFGTVDLLKIDTQGWERQVLDGARELIERDWPVLIVEIPLNDPQENYAMRKWVCDEFGYGCHAMIKKNCIFFRRRAKDAEAG